MIVSSIDPKNLFKASMDIDTNVLLFDILFRYKAKLDGERIVITINGKPFRGSFEAKITVETPYVKDIENESTST